MRSLFVTTVALVMAVALSGNAYALILEWATDDGGNGHFYELVSDSLNWDDARDGAAARTYLGSTGYLVTITSAEENAFLTASFELNHQWIGAFQFDKLAEPDGHWRWVTDEPFVYTNWNQVPPHFEPNESGVEDWAAFGTPEPAPDGTDLEGKWQDWKFFGDPLPNRPRGYFVEYEPIPEPSSFFLLGSGLLSLVGWRRRNIS